MVSEQRYAFFRLPLWFLAIGYNELKEAVSAYKNSETGERKMSSVWKEVEDEGITKGIEKGIIQGKLERSSEVARNLLMKNKMSEAEIAEVTDLSLDEVSKIKSQMKSL